MPPVAVYAQLTRDRAQGQALSFGLLRGRLLRGEFPAGWRFTVIVVDSGILDDGVGLQVGRVPQLCWTDTVVAQAFHDATDFRRGSRGAMGSARRVGSAWAGRSFGRQPVPEGSGGAFDPSLSQIIQSFPDPAGRFLLEIMRIGAMA